MVYSEFIQGTLRSHRMKGNRGKKCKQKGKEKGNFLRKEGAKGLVQSKKKEAKCIMGELTGFQQA